MHSLCSRCMLCSANRAFVLRYSNSLLQPVRMVSNSTTHSAQTSRDYEPYVVWSGMDKLSIIPLMLLNFLWVEFGEKKYFLLSLSCSIAVVHSISHIKGLRSWKIWPRPSQQQYSCIHNAIVVLVCDVFGMFALCGHWSSLQRWCAISFRIVYDCDPGFVRCIRVL